LVDFAKVYLPRNETGRLIRLEVVVAERSQG
jgi:hypothetical protein